MMDTYARNNPKYITAGRQVVLKAMCEAPILVSKQAARLIEVIFYRCMAKDYACMMAEGTLDVYPGRPF